MEGQIVDRFKWYGVDSSCVVMAPIPYPLWIAAIFGANLVLGFGLVVGVYKLMEQRVAAGAFGGIALGAIIIYAETTVGESLFSPTVSEMKLMVLAAAAGAVLGVVGTVFTFEPEV